MPKLFIGTTPEKDNGWMMCQCGASNGDHSKDYVITTNYLKADEVPEHCMDAKTFSQLCAGLLNCFYSGHDVTGLSPEDIIKRGMPNEELDIPHPSNPTLPF